MSEDLEIVTQQIVRLNDEWMRAVRERDAATLDRIIADDFLIAGWQPEGKLADKQFLH